MIYSLFTAVDNPELCRVIPDPFRRRHSLFHNILPHFIFFIFIFHKGRRAQICRQFGYCLVRDPRFPLNIWRCTRNESAEKKRTQENRTTSSSKSTRAAGVVRLFFFFTRYLYIAAAEDVTSVHAAHFIPLYSLIGRR